MSISIDKIYCRQLLFNDRLNSYCKNCKYRDFFINPHRIMHVKDTINFKCLETNDFTIYKEYIDGSEQREHSVENYQNLHNTFNINAMPQIKLEYNDQLGKYIVTDGVHRLCIMVLKKIYPDRIPLSKLNITYHSDTITSIKNIMTKTTEKQYSNSWSNRTSYGYHSFNLFNINIPGQRNPSQRLKIIKQSVDFKDKTVIDFGCNSGGMLLHLPEIKRGFGYDFSKECIDTANFINSVIKFNDNLSFIEKDLNDSNFPELINVEVDIIFLLALGSWIKNWKELYTYAVNKTKLIIYETNNDQEAKPQLELFKELNCDISIISSQSTDDITNNFGRKTYLIKSP